jgi:DNA-directed RNA polymerase subunit RPC12/RpoP
MTEYDCTCGRTLRYRQDMERRTSGVETTWVCRDCGTPVPSMTAEKLRHRDPS